MCSSLLSCCLFVMQNQSNCWLGQLGRAGPCCLERWRCGGVTGERARGFKMETFLVCKHYRRTFCYSRHFPINVSRSVAVCCFACHLFLVSFVMFLLTCSHTDWAWYGRELHGVCLLRLQVSKVCTCLTRIFLVANGTF